MATRIIDALLVTLGLDDSGYREGSRRVTRELNTTRKNVADASLSMSKAISSAARQFALAFLGFNSAAGLVRMLGNLNEAARRIDMVARNTGNAARELKQYANAAEIAGGSTEGLLSTIEQIREQQASFRLRGEAPWLPFLRSLRVTGTDWAFKGEIDILNELAEAFERVKDMPGQGREMAYSLGREMGIDQGTINFLLKGPEAIKELVARQEALTRNYDKTARSAAVLRERWQYLKQQAESLGLTLLTQLQPHLIKLADWLSTVGAQGINSGEWAKGIVTGVESITAAVRELWTLLNDVKVKFDDIANSPVVKFVFRKSDDGKPKSLTQRIIDTTPLAFLKPSNFVTTWQENRDKYTPALAAAERTYGLPEGTLQSYAQQRSRWTDTTINGRFGGVGKPRVDARGVFNMAGSQGVDADVATLGPALQSLMQEAKRSVLRGVGVGTVLDPGYTRLGQDAFYGLNPFQATAAAQPGFGTVLNDQVRSYGTEIDIGSIIIQTQAQNAQGIAAEVESTIRRRLEVAQFDSGMR